LLFLLGESKSETAAQRLAIMTRTNDGFEIAQKDLDLRGPGELLGVKQHGADEERVLRLAQNMDVLLLAQKAADRLLSAGKKDGNAAIFDRAAAIYFARMREIASN
jgi:ATP-dependent DNA helicase RecG